MTEPRKLMDSTEFHAIRTGHIELRKEVAECRDEVRDVDTRVEHVEGRLERLNDKLDHIKDAIDKLVTRHEFYPVRLIAYGLAGGILMTVLMAVLSKVVLK